MLCRIVRDAEGCGDVREIECHVIGYAITSQGMKWGTRPVLRGCEGFKGVSHCHIIIQGFISVNL